MISDFQRLSQIEDWNSFLVSHQGKFDVQDLRLWFVFVGFFLCGGTFFQT